MLVDGLTKRNASTVTLLELMRRAAFRLTDESTEIVAREAEKIRGYVPRAHRRHAATESREIGNPHDPDPNHDRCAVGCYSREL